MSSSQRRVHLDEVKFMLGAGESPNRIARRLGVRPKSVADVIRRRINAGEYPESDRPLAAVFEKAERSEHEKRPCVDCGDKIVAFDSKSGRCSRCAMGLLWADPVYREKQGIGMARVAERRPRLGNGQFAG